MYETVINAPPTHVKLMIPPILVRIRIKYDDSCPPVIVKLTMQSRS